MEKRYSFEQLQTEINNKTPKESIEILKVKISFYYEWKYKEGRDYTPQLFEFNFIGQAESLLDRIENENSNSYNHDWNWFFNADNIPNQDAVFETKDFIEKYRKEDFEGLYFLNLLFKQLHGLKDNLDKPFDFVTNLKAIPLNETQRHLLFGMILFWHGGYPVNNLNPKYNTILKLIEREFLSMFPNEITLEKEFCKKNKEFNTQLKDLENKINNNMPILLSGGKFHPIEFDYEDLPNWIILKGIQQRYDQRIISNESDYSLWQADLRKFLESVPEPNKLKTIQKGIEYGKIMYDFHLKKECSNPSYCPYDQSWIRRITLAENLLAEINPLPSQKTISIKNKLDFTKDKLKVIVLELANLNGYEKPSTYLNEILNEIKQFNSFEFECDFFLNIHYLCVENIDKFWSEGHRKDISEWFKKAPFKPTKIINVEQLENGEPKLVDVPLFSTTWETSVFQTNETQSVQKANVVSKTKKIISDEFENLDKIKGWKYAFGNEQDYNMFLDLLTSYFEYKPYSMPTELINLKRDCKTRFAKALSPIHKELSNENKKLKSDAEFFKIIRLLNHFSKLTDTQIYDAITR